MKLRNSRDKIVPFVLNSPHWIYQQLLITVRLYHTLFSQPYAMPEAQWDEIGKGDLLVVWSEMAGLFFCGLRI